MGEPNAPATLRHPRPEQRSEGYRVSDSNRWGVYVAASVVCAKALIALWWYSSHGALAYRLFILADPIATKLAFAVDELVFQRRPLAPPPIESRLFELVSVAVGGLEGFVVGWLGGVIQ